MATATRTSGGRRKGRLVKFCFALTTIHRSHSLGPSRRSWLPARRVHSLPTLVRVFAIHFRCLKHEARGSIAGVAG